MGKVTFKIGADTRGNTNTNTYITVNSNKPDTANLNRNPFAEQVLMNQANQYAKAAGFNPPRHAEEAQLLLKGYGI